MALIAKGVRFPPGQWVRLANGNVLPWMVGDLFPALNGRSLIFAVLMSEFDVKEFEAGRYGPP